MSEFREGVTTDSEEGRIELPEEEVDEQEAVEADFPAKFLSMAEQLEAVNNGKKEGLLAIRDASSEEKDKLINDYNDNLERSRQLSLDLQQAKGDMKKDGWIFSRDGNSAFQVKIETGKDGKKLFKIADTVGKTPVQKGQAFPAYVSSAHNIPESVRDKIMESFTYDGDGAKELYVNVPETE